MQNSVVMVTFSLFDRKYPFWADLVQNIKVPKITRLNVFRISQKEVRDKVDFLHADKHQNFLQVDFNTLGVKVFYKVIYHY